MTTVSDELRMALDGDDPREALSTAVRRLIGRGRPSDTVLADLESLRGALRGEGREEAEDIVLEVMDFVTGWCSPHARI